VARTRKGTTTVKKVYHCDHGVVAFAGTGGGWSTAIEIDGHAKKVPTKAFGYRGGYQRHRRWVHDVVNYLIDQKYWKR
jgi:hypothetical protein